MSADHELAVVPSPSGPGDGFVELAKTGQGRIFRKHILRLGTYPHPSNPNKKLDITPELIDTLVQNFDDGVCDIVQAPKVGASNEHVEDPDRNTGEVIKLEKREDGGLNAIYDARTADAEKVGKTLLGASAMMHLNYTDTRTGERKGPTLLHMAITNRPFITNLDPFEEIVAASADTSADEVVMYSEEGLGMPTKEELIQQLKDEHGVDVELLLSNNSDQEIPSADEFAASVARVLAERGVITLSNTDDPESEEISTREIAEAVIELAQTNEAQSDEIKHLREANEAARKNAAEKEVDDLVLGGRVLPKQRDKMVEFAMNDRETFDALLPEDSIVALTEEGVTTHEDTSSEDETEIARLAALGNARKKGVADADTTSTEN